LGGFFKGWRYRHRHLGPPGPPSAIEGACRLCCHSTWCSKAQHGACSCARRWHQFWLTDACGMTEPCCWVATCTQNGSTGYVDSLGSAFCLTGAYPLTQGHGWWHCHRHLKEQHGKACSQVFAFWLNTRMSSDMIGDIATRALKSSALGSLFCMALHFATTDACDHTDSRWWHRHRRS